MSKERHSGKGVRIPRYLPFTARWFVSDSTQEGDGFTQGRHLILQDLIKKGHSRDRPGSLIGSTFQTQRVL
jgi:hypothetical protein